MFRHIQEYKERYRDASAFAHTHTYIYMLPYTNMCVYLYVYVYRAIFLSFGVGILIGLRLHGVQASGGGQGCRTLGISGLPKP